jgi:hypothetical protein
MVHALSVKFGSSFWEHIDDCKKNSNGHKQEKRICTPATVRELSTLAIYDFLMFNNDRFKPQAKWRGFNNNLFLSLFIR